MAEKNTTKKNPHAVALGQLGGRKGGPARAANMTAEQRQEASRKAGIARGKKLTPQQRRASASKAGKASWAKKLKAGRTKVTVKPGDHDLHSANSGPKSVNAPAENNPT